MTQFLNTTMFPIDIHTHHQPVQASTAIVSMEPDVLHVQSGGWYSVGFHPWHLSVSDVGVLPWDLFRSVALHPQVLAVGEIGLDKLTQASLEWQEEVFVQQAVYAERIGKPVIIHLVKAIDRLLQLKRTLCPAVPWIIHGFRGKPQQADSLLQHGFYLSVGEHYSEETLRMIPLNQLFLETDESSVPIQQLYRQVAFRLGMSVEHLSATLHCNVMRVFFAGK